MTTKKQKILTLFWDNQTRQSWNMQGCIYGLYCNMQGCIYGMMIWGQVPAMVRESTCYGPHIATPQTPQTLHNTHYWAKCKMVVLRPTMQAQTGQKAESDPKFWLQNHRFPNIWHHSLLFTRKPQPPSLIWLYRNSSCLCPPKLGLIDSMLLKRLSWEWTTSSVLCLKMNLKSAEPKVLTRQESDNVSLFLIILVYSPLNRAARATDCFSKTFNTWIPPLFL